MPHRPRLKLCDVCDQVSFARGSSRDLRCYAPVPPDGSECGSRLVRPITVAELNLERALRRTEISELRTTSANHEARLEELEEVLTDLRATHKAELEELRAQNRLLADAVDALRRQVRDLARR